MLFPIYKSVKERLAEQVSQLKDIALFNNQYAGLIHTEPLLLIEFPDAVDVTSVSKTHNRSLTSIRLHVISKGVSDADNTITDKQIEDHESLVSEVLSAADLFTPSDSDSISLSTKLQYIRYQKVNDYKGWLVTQLTFNLKL